MRLELFGIAIVRARVYPRGPAIGHAVAPLALALAASFPDAVFTKAVCIAAGVGGVAGRSGHVSDRSGRMAG
jgi:hypothetical protein